MQPEGPGAWAASTETEQSLLGALLLDNSALARAAELVAAVDFYTEDHREIHKAIVAIVQAGHHADITTVGDRLKRESAERFERMGGYAYLASLAQNTPSAANAHRYAELVREKALCRRLDALALDVSRTVRAPGGRSIHDLIGELQGQARALAEASAPWRALKASSAPEFIGRAFPPLEPLLAPFLFQKNLGMIHAKRGVGKTHAAMAMAYAVATGGRFLCWTAPSRRRVLYIDGEMPAQLMQRRLRELASAQGEIPDTFHLITPDEQGRPMPDLATAAGQAEIDALIVVHEPELVVVDNLSCMVRSGGAENESESWGSVADWALKHRRAGRAVLFIHHSGKTGAQRGTSRREDLLDLVINLRRPAEYQEADGAVFEVHFEKARSLTGEDIAPVEAKLEQLAGGGYGWTWASAATRLQDRIRDLWEGGQLSLTDVARDAPCSKSHAHQVLHKAMQAGSLRRDYPARSRKNGGGLFTEPK